MRKVKFQKGKIYHIYNRGVEKRDIFIADADMWRFIQGMFLFNDRLNSFNTLYQIEKENKGRINFNLLKEFIEKNGKNRDCLVNIMADCLMPNHFHLLLQSINDDGIPRFMQKLGTGYTVYFNKKYNRNGHLFQGPYKAVEIKNNIQLMQIIVYINVINPGQLIKLDLKEKRIERMEELEKIMNFARNYSFSTNPDYLGIRNSIIIDKNIYNSFFGTSGQYENYIKDFLLGKMRNSIGDITLELT